jgi:LysM repeat protein
MLSRVFICAILSALLLAGCATPVPLWQNDAHLLFDKVRLEGAQDILPIEYRSIEDLLLKADQLVANGDVESADTIFRFALAKGKLLEENVNAERIRRQEAEQQRIEAEKQEKERQLAILEEQRRLEIAKAEAEAEARLKAEAEAKKAKEKAKSVREKPLPSQYTVKRGETLPMIAAQQDIYNDANLWPLIYRSNRDQIGDPRHIWPGQVLRIPRNVSRDDYAEARRYSQERPLR